MKYIPVLATLVAGLALAQVPPSHPAFDNNDVHEIYLTFSQPDFLDQLTYNFENFEDVPYIEATLQWGSQKFERVGIRYKGNSSYNGARNSKKKPFRIKLNEFVKGQKLSGMGSFNLSNAWNDPSFVRENAYYKIAADLGLKAPRSNFAALYINGEYWGLYVLGEIVNSDFLKAYFGSGDDGGNLYKAGSPGATLAYLGDDKAAYKSVFEKQSNEDADDWTDFIALVKLLNETPSSELKAKLDPIMDIDSVLTALALDNLTANLDSYVGMAQNYYLYRRPSDNKWVWIVWDPSLAFGGLGFGLSTDAMKTMTVEWVSTTATFGGGAQGGGQAGTQASVGRPLASKMWEVPEYKARYREIYKRLVTEVFFPDLAVARMNALRDMIRPWVQKDENKLVTMDQFEQAMTTDSTSTMGGNPGDGGTPPTNPGGQPPTTPPGGQPPTTPPGGQPGAQPGGGAGGGMSTPGIEPFVKARVASVKEQLGVK